MKAYGVNGYQKKNRKQLLKEIDECKSISQLFALIQHEQIVIQMHTQSGASNLTPKKLSPKEIISQKDTPFERLKLEVKKSVMARVEESPLKPAKIDKSIK